MNFTNDFIKTFINVDIKENNKYKTCRQSKGTTNIKQVDIKGNNKYKTCRQSKGTTNIKHVDIKENNKYKTGRHQRWFL
jgi:hypothetical protein